MKLNKIFSWLFVGLMAISASTLTSCEDQPDKFELTGGDCPRTQIPIGGNLQIESERPDDMGKTSESLAELGGNQSGYAQEISNRKFETPSNGVIGRPPP